MKRTHGIFSLALLAGLTLWGLVLAKPGAPTQTNPAPSPAVYRVKLLSQSPPKLGVTATLPIDGSLILMETTRPADVPGVGEQGWPALVRNLRISDEQGHPLEASSTGPAGWKMSHAYKGRLTLEYEVDYSGPAALDWPAPREAAFGDPDHFVFIGRSAFITTPEVLTGKVLFSLPSPWRAVAPWAPSGASGNDFVVESVQDLCVNLIALTRAETDVVAAEGFRVFITPLGHWQSPRRDVKEVLEGVIPRFVKLFDFKERAGYSIILLPLLELGGESFQNSFALTMDAPPSRANRLVWGSLIAHEIFHFWNGSRLRGADYASSQWFQEGFTNYSADLAMAASGLMDGDGFRERLSGYLRGYQKLATPLDAPGTRKGPPLYGGGALVAFCWDVQIRKATGNTRRIGDFLSTLWRQTDHGRRAYDWSDIRTALTETAALDWEAFFKAYIHGTEKLPLEETLALAGLRLARTVDGLPLIEADPRASDSAKAIGRAILEGR